MHPLTDGVPAPAEVLQGPALSAPAHRLDRLGHEQPPLAALEGLGGVDEDGDHLGLGSHLRKLLGLLVKRPQDTGDLPSFKPLKGVAGGWRWWLAPILSGIL